MSPNLVSEALGLKGGNALLVRPVATRRRASEPLQEHRVTPDLKRCAASTILSVSLLCGQGTLPGQALAAKVSTEQPYSGPALPGRPAAAAHLPLAVLAPPPLASAIPASLSGVAAVAEEAEELVVDVFHFLQHGVEAAQSTVHPLQVVHALERLEGMPLNQVVDLDLLKLAMHPASTSTSSAYDEGAEQPPSAPSPEASARLDAALDGVAEWRLRDVVDVGKLANALQDVPVSDPLDPRALQREAIRIRRTVHWEALADAVKPQPLRRALTAFGSDHGSPFFELDMRAAVSAVRMDTVRKVLHPPRPAAQRASHGLESSGMWTWDSM